MMHIIPKINYFIENVTGILLIESDLLEIVLYLIKKNISKINLSH